MFTLMLSCNPCKKIKVLGFEKTWQWCPKWAWKYFGPKWPFAIFAKSLFFFLVFFIQWVVIWVGKCFQTLKIMLTWYEPHFTYWYKKQFNCIVTYITCMQFYLFLFLFFLSFSLFVFEPKFIVCGSKLLHSSSTHSLKT